VLVTTSVYVVVVVGFAVGFDTVVDDKLTFGVHAYVTPATLAAPICNPFGFWVHVFVKSAPALALGTTVFTVTMTRSVAVHPFAGFVAVTV
jgi:hypothetical protein